MLGFKYTANCHTVGQGEEGSGAGAAEGAPTGRRAEALVDPELVL